MGPPFTKIYTGHYNIVTCVLPLNANTFATGSGDLWIKLWEITTGSCLATLKGHMKDIWGLCMISQTEIASCSSDSSIKIWSIDKLINTHTLMGHIDVVRCIVFLPDFNMLASGGMDLEIRLWDLKDKTLCSTGGSLGRHEGMIRVLLYLEHRKRLISGSADRTIKVWDVKKMVK